MKLSYPKKFIENNEPKEIEKAGEYPFTRGIYPEMYKKKRPTIREFAGHGLASDTNERFRLILANGGTGLSTAFDLPTLMGKDSDEEICEGQVGWDGVAIDSLADMEELFLGIPIANISVSMTINAPAAMIWAMYIAMVYKRNIPFFHLAGTLQNDILKEYSAQKEWLYPEEHGVKLVVDTIEYASRFFPKWHPVSISGYHIREAGATAIEELAFTESAGIEYVRQTLKRKMTVDEFAPQLSFFFDLHNNFFEEIAKLRAARRLWAKIMLEMFAAKNPKSQWCRMHVQTAGVTLTAQEPLNNIARIAIQTLAGMLGGAQSIHANSYDEVLCTPTEEAVRTAIRTQQILQEETGICNFIDSLGGAHAVEKLTEHIFNEAWKEIETIENMGGMLEAVKMGYPQSRIRKSAKDQEEAMESGKLIKIGVNKFRQNEIIEPKNVREELKTRRGFEKTQVERLQKMKSSRDKSKVKLALELVMRHAEAGTNLMGPLVEAAASYATLGEMCSALGKVFGEYQEKNRDFAIPEFTGSMKRTAEKYRLPRPLRIILAKGGLDGHDRVINTVLAFCKELGAEVIFPGLHTSLRAVVKRAVEEDADIIGLSTHIGNPVVYFERLREYLKSYGAKSIKMIGGGIVTSDDLAMLPALGVEKFFPGNPPFEEIAKFLFEEAKNERK